MTSFLARTNKTIMGLAEKYSNYCPSTVKTFVQIRYAIEFVINTVAQLDASLPISTANEALL